MLKLDINPLNKSCNSIASFDNDDVLSKEVSFDNDCWYVLIQSLNRVSNVMNPQGKSF